MASTHLFSLWMSRKLATSYSALWEAAGHHLTPAHRIFAVRRFQYHVQTTTREAPEVTTKRWRRNLSRIYARRVLEIAAASAATQRFIAQLEQHVVDKPADWHNWERKYWADELLASLGSTKLSRFWSAFSRICSLTLLAAPMAILYPLSHFSKTAEAWSWSYALFGIEKAGPTFTKLTQWATTRHDLFSPEFCSYFGRLQDNTVGHKWKDTQAILKKDLGDAALRYLQLEKEPIGSGCIAQVYRGRLTQAAGQYPTGTEVAVKVQHPGIWHKVCVDFYIMGKAARFLEGLPYLNLKYLSLIDTVSQFRDVMLPQLDLTLEAKHLQRFNRDFSSNPRVSFPTPLHDLTSTRVLTETFMHGTPILEYTKADEKARRDLAYLGLETTLQMIFLHDFLHGDLHPGNMLVHQAPKDGSVHLHMLDCGLVIEMGPEQHVNLTKILGAFIRQDGRMAGKLMVDTSSSSQASPLDVELFVHGIYNIVEADKDNNFVEKVGDYITDICFLACKHKVKLEASFVNAALSVEIMEGIASALYPDMKVVPVALPLVVKAEMMHRLPKFSLW